VGVAIKRVGLICRDQFATVNVDLTLKGYCRLEFSGVLVGEKIGDIKFALSSPIWSPLLFWYLFGW